MSNGTKAAKYHQHPTVSIVEVQYFPRIRFGPNHVDKNFWIMITDMLVMLERDKAIKIEFDQPVYTNINSGCYWAAKKAGIKISVARKDRCVYIRRRESKSTKQFVS